LRRRAGGAWNYSDQGERQANCECQYEDDEERITSPDLPRNLFGQRGWQRNLRLGLIDYDNLLYLSVDDS
jgi:hypothetical protein